MTDAGSWLLVDFVCPAGSADILAGDLWARGVAAVEEIDNPDGTVTLRTSLGEDASAGVADLSRAHPDVLVRPVEIPRSVADTWRSFVGPTHVIDDVWLVPEWCGPPAGRTVMVEPFDTFGLGNHPTTVLALASALGVCGPGDPVMDLGSGSGVLAVAMARLVGARVDAHDIAPQAATALAHNARLNGVEGLVSWRDALGPADAGRYGLVIANILAPVLRELSTDIMRATLRGGHIVLSGMRTEQVTSVTGSYTDCTEIDRRELDGWSAVVLRRE